MAENIIKIKSYQFAVRIVKVYQFLGEKRSEYVVSKQLLRAGTSIGANVEEAIGGQSKKDFISKLSISYKEAREAHFWIRLLADTGYLTKSQSSSLLADCEELLKILGKIIKSSKATINS